MATTTSEIRYALTPDGRRVAYAAAGAGSPVLLVPGANGHHRAWDHVLPFLTPHVATYALARRGRGLSAEVDAASFDISGETDDVLAVLAAIDAPAHLVGHSSGAVLALEAARRAPSLHTLTLYEPKFGANPGEITPDLGRRLQIMLAAGDRAGVIEAVMREEVGMAAEIDQWRASPSWARLEAIAPVFVREIATLETYRFDPDRFRSITLPVLTLSGDRSPVHFHDSTARVRAALPWAEHVELAGHGHNAIVSGPGLFATALLDFLRRHDPAISPSEKMGA